MKTKLELPTINWRGIHREPQITIWTHRVTCGVRWSIYTLDVDFVLSEEIRKHLNSRATESLDEMCSMFDREVRKNPKASLRAFWQGSLAWGSANYVTPEFAKHASEYMAEKFIAAMEHCAKNQEKILKEWEEWSNPK